MIVVSDAGPLMALAKIDALDALFLLFPEILTAPAVYTELVTEGLRLGAPDALLLQGCYRSGELKIVSSQNGPPKERLGPGEEQSILLAIELKANWLLMDDLEARRSALADLAAAGSRAQIKGTLGVILVAREMGYLTLEEAVDSVESIRQRQDIWISADLCQRVLNRLAKDST